MTTTELIERIEKHILRLEVLWNNKLEQLEDRIEALELELS